MNYVSLLKVPPQAPIILDDAEIDRAAERYAKVRAEKRIGISFERYLLLRGPRAGARRSATPEARMEISLEADGFAIRGGQWVEKLRHRVWPRKALKTDVPVTRRRA